MPIFGSRSVASPSGEEDSDIQTLDDTSYSFDSETRRPVAVVHTSGSSSEEEDRSRDVRSRGDGVSREGSSHSGRYNLPGNYIAIPTATSTAAITRKQIFATTPGTYEEKNIEVLHPPMEDDCATWNDASISTGEQEFPGKLLGSGVTVDALQDILQSEHEDKQEGSVPSIYRGYFKTSPASSSSSSSSRKKSPRVVTPSSSSTNNHSSVGADAGSESIFYQRDVEYGAGSIRTGDDTNNPDRPPLGVTQQEQNQKRSHWVMRMGRTGGRNDSAAAEAASPISTTSTRTPTSTIGTLDVEDGSATHRTFPSFGDFTAAAATPSGPPFESTSSSAGMTRSSNLHSRDGSDSVSSAGKQSLSQMRFHHATLPALQTLSEREKSSTGDQSDEVSFSAASFDFSVDANLTLGVSSRGDETSHLATVDRAMVRGQMFANDAEPSLMGRTDFENSIVTMPDVGLDSSTGNSSKAPSKDGGGSGGGGTRAGMSGRSNKPNESSKHRRQQSRKCIWILVLFLLFLVVGAVVAGWICLTRECKVHVFRSKGAPDTNDGVSSSSKGKPEYELPTRTPSAASPTSPLSPTSPSSFSEAGNPRPTPMSATSGPTAMPSTKRTNTNLPTLQPSMGPTRGPVSSAPVTFAPTTSQPTASPVTYPTTARPTVQPTASPTRPPSPAPTGQPTRVPTQRPVTPLPTASPTRSPTARPTKTPTARPTKAPTTPPTSAPTGRPSPPPIPALVLSSADELYNAVDSYMEDRSSTPPINEWDVSAITDFSYVFSANRNPATADFNDDLDKWDTSNALTMRSMFREAKKFNGNIATFDTALVEDMTDMFSRAESFKGDLSNWVVDRVTDMKGTFRRTSFNGDLSRWKTGKVTDMSYMFFASQFNRDVSSWSVSAVTNMESMFRYASAFNQDLNSWDTARVTNMNKMFLGATSFNGNVLFETSEVTDMAEMFEYASSFEGIGAPSFDTRNVERMDRMFYGAAAFNRGLSGWRLSSVKSLSHMFAGASEFESDLCSWSDKLRNRGSSLEDEATESMFVGTKCPRQDDPVVSDLGRSAYCDECDFSAPAPPFSPSSDISDGFTGQAFVSTDELRDAADAYMLDNSDVSDVALKYGYPIGSWNVGRITDFSELFSGTRNTAMLRFDEDLSRWDLSSATTLRQMFEHTISFKEHSNSLKRWGTSSVEDMHGMFIASSFSGDISRWDVGRVRDFEYFARYAVSFDSDLADWDVSSAETMGNMFTGAKAFQSDLSNWDISSCLDFRHMFNGASSFGSNLCSWGELVREDAELRFIFSETRCPIEASPSMLSGPWCYPCW